MRPHQPHRGTWLLAGALSLAGVGCSTDFAPEMNVKSGEKLRPLAVVCEPAEAMPGDTVRVTTCYYDPQVEATGCSWQLAQDYRIDRYGELHYEGSVIALDPLLLDPETAVDDDGLVTQRFSFVLPDSCLRISSGVPDLDAPDIPPGLLEILQPAGDRPTQEEWDAFLRDVDPSALTPAELIYAQGLSELFTCQVRLRCRLRGAISVDVTRNLTVRYARRFASDNVNLNPTISAIGWIAVHAADVDDPDDIGAHEADTTYVYRHDPAAPVTRALSVRTDWSYFMFMEHDEQSYRSPAGITHVEDHEYYWYFTPSVPRADDDPFFLEKGEEPDEMYELDEIVGVDPPYGPGPQRYRIHLVLRDFRPEWRMFNGTPGTDYVSFDLVFEPR